METNPPATSPTSRPSVTVRWARLSDLGPILRLYRGQSAESRQFYHPYPFDRFRLGPILFALLVSSRIVRLMLRLAPNYAFVILIAEEPGEAAPIGFCTARFVRRHGDPIWAQFGYLVRHDRRGRGIGSYLAIAQWRTARALGVLRGGGTILEGNIASSRVVEPFGFHLEPTGQPDARAADRQNLGSIQDLNEVLERVRRQGGWRAEALHDPIPR
jgi:RimJ/RimL family protein N-acetyltransferase